MHAYYFDNQPGDQRLPHHNLEPSSSVDVETLKRIKVESWNIPVEKGYEEKLDDIAKERAYKNRDVITLSKENLGEVSPYSLGHVFIYCSYKKMSRMVNAYLGL